MEQYLLPAGLVEEAPRSDTDHARQFRLTGAGAAWLDTHSEEIRTPASREEIRDLAREGYEAGTSARDSVQNYRKQLHRLKNRHDALEDNVEEIADQQEKDDTALDWLWERSETNKERSEDTKKTVEDLAEAVDEIAKAVEERATIGTK
jgi:chromosome segregation ATPase